MSAEVVASLALALGREFQGTNLSWTEVFAVSRRERLAPLSWLRSAAVIRREAPESIVVGWRAEALSAVGLAEFWGTVLVETLEILKREAVEAVVLKGLPLSQRLYGHLAARPCSDIDLFVPPRQRQVAHTALLSAGWIWRSGESPREGSYRLNSRGRVAPLELHSALLDDGLVAHLPFNPPRAKFLPVAGVTMPVHQDDQLPAFLAAHLAKHSMAPLLWFVDFDACWKSLSADGQRKAMRAATAARANLYLQWAIDCGAEVNAAADGDASALSRLGFAGAGRAEMHTVRRVAQLAATPIDALRVTTAWLVPHDVRRQLGALLWLTAGRFSKAFHGAARSRRSYSVVGEERGPLSHAKSRSLLVESADFRTLVTEMCRCGAAFSIRARGNSMRPAIRGGTVVCLTPRNGSPVKVGDVVLAMTAGGKYVLHRVRRACGGQIETHGDANPVADAPVALESVVAVANAILIDGWKAPIPKARLTRAVRRMRAALRNHLRRSQAVHRIASLRLRGGHVRSDE